MKNIPISAFVVLSALLLAACKEKSTDPVSRQVISFSALSSKCMGGILKMDSQDSLFNYTFIDTLLVNFLVPGNCCPDSDRFVVTHTPAADTLTISVIDTAANLCRCTCPYMIHASFAELPNDQYIVRCMLGNPSGNTELIYLVKVRRNR